MGLLLPCAQQLVDPRRGVGRHDHGLAEVTLVVGGLLLEDVAREGMATADLAGRSLREALLGAGGSLHFRHAGGAGKGPPDGGRGAAPTTGGYALALPLAEAPFFDGSASAAAGASPATSGSGAGA